MNNVNIFLKRFIHNVILLAIKFSAAFRQVVSKDSDYTAFANNFFVRKSTII